MPFYAISKQSLVRPGDDAIIVMVCFEVKIEVMDMPAIQELLKEHPEEWLAIEVTEEQDGQPHAGKLIYHARDREEVWQKTKDRRRLYITYAGPALKKGYAAAF